MLICVGLCRRVCFLRRRSSGGSRHSAPAGHRCGLLKIHGFAPKAETRRCGGGTGRLRSGRRRASRRVFQASAACRRDQLSVFVKADQGAGARGLGRQQKTRAAGKPRHGNVSASPISASGALLGACVCQSACLKCEAGRVGVIVVGHVAMAERQRRVNRALSSFEAASCAWPLRRRTVARTVSRWVRSVRNVSS